MLPSLYILKHVCGADCHCPVCERQSVGGHEGILPSTLAGEDCPRNCLRAGKYALDQMIEWRESAARVGADEALCYILSCYETLELEKVVGVRGLKVDQGSRTCGDSAEESPEHDNTRRYS